jgi:broad specificity phosphatase PhoE
VTVVLVRHGHAAAGWGESLDPGLDDVGRAQAAAAAEALHHLGPCPLSTSPLRRTRETAAAFASRWGDEPFVDPRVGEIMAPEAMGLADRAEWLAGVMRSRWSDLELGLQQWRNQVLDAFVELGAGDGIRVVVTHFVAINVAVGAASGDARVTCFLPDNCSATVLEVDGGSLRLVERGAEAVTEIR